MVDPIAAQRSVGKGYELRLVIAAGVDGPREVGIDGYNAIVRR